VPRAIGTFEYFAGIKDAGFGDVMLMIALMVGVQAEIVFQRAKSLTGAAPAAPRHEAVAASTRCSVEDCRAC
jgi:hypothetical protein